MHFSLHYREPWSRSTLTGTRTDTRASIFTPKAIAIIRMPIILLCLFLCACTDAALKAINTPSYFSAELELESNLSYGEEAHQKLDLYLPPQGVGTRDQLILFIYGGDWTSGSKENYYFVADALTSAGYVVAIPDYIKYPEGTFPAFVEDVAQSVHWLSRHIEQFADVDELILMGHSAGAHTGALLVTDPRYLAAHQLPAETIHAFVGLAGPYAYLPEDKKYRDIFGNLDDYSEMQPLHFVTGSEPPMLLLHGSRDTTVLPIHTRKFAEKVNARGGSASTRFYPKREHADMVLALSRFSDESNDVRTQILDFLQQKLPHIQDAVD